MISNLPLYPFFLPSNLPILSVVPNLDNIFQWILSRLQFRFVQSQYGLFAQYPNGICIPYSLLKNTENKKLWYNVMFSEIESCINTWKGKQCDCGFCCAYLNQSHADVYLKLAFRRLYGICVCYNMSVTDTVFGSFPKLNDNCPQNHTILPVQSIPVLHVRKN